jgi:hypothetical protein
VRLPNDDVDRLADQIEAALGDPRALWRGIYPHHARPEQTVGIVRADGNPFPDTSTFCTFGLAHLSWEDRQFVDRFELVSACTPASPEYGRVLATVAHLVIDERLFVGPGSILSDALRVCDPDGVGARLPHLVGMFPYLWGTRLESFTLSVGRVWLMQLQPISEAERQYCLEHGWEDGLEVVFEAFRPRLHDLNRKSVL